MVRSVLGADEATAVTLLALVPEMGARSPKAFVAIAGLLPFNHDSGKLRGAFVIRGGRKRARDALYMAAVSASRSNSSFKDNCQHLREDGKLPNLAFIAIA